MPHTLDSLPRSSSAFAQAPAAIAHSEGTLRRRTALAALAATAAGLAAPGAAWAQAASDRPLRLVLPVSAGSGVDGLARAFGPGLGKALGRGVVIENFPGAGGITGTSVIVKAPKDGTVLGMVSNNHVVNPSVYKTIPESLFYVFLGIALECNRDEWMPRMRRMGSCPCKQPGRAITRFHSNPSGKCLAGRSALLRRLPIAKLLAAHRA